MSVRQAVRLPDESVALPRGVRRAVDAMRAAPGRDFDLAELAAIAETPPRTLQRQFRAFLGKSPLDALRDFRFEAVRRELLRAPSRAKVIDIASRTGFTHFGRFSAEYRRRYGENPSQTLERRQRISLTRPAQPLPALSRPERPILAVVPVEVGAGEKDIAHGVADAIAGALVRSGLAVTSRPQSASYQLLTTFRGNGHQARLTVRLFEQATGRYLWAHHSDGATADVLLFEDQVAAGVAAAVQAGLRAAEIARAAAKPDTDLGAYDLTLRAMPFATALRAESGSRALDLLDRALDLDPTNALALALAAWCHGQRVVYQFTEDPAGESARALSLATQAAAGHGDATVHAVLGNAFAAAHRLDMADHVTRTALAMDGGSAWAWTRSGWIDVYADRPAAAIERFAISLELAPHDSLAFNALVGLGGAYFDLGRYEDAANALERALAAHPSAGWAHRMLSPAYALLGRKAEAQRSLAGLHRLYPGVTISQVTAAIPFPQDFRDRIANGFDSLGLPP